MNSRRSKKRSGKPNGNKPEPTESAKPTAPSQSPPAGKADESQPDEIAKQPADLLTSNPNAAVPALPTLSRILSVVMLILGILVVGALFLQVMAGFFVPLFLAAVLVVIFRPVYQWVFVKSGGKRRIAALATTSLVLLIVLLPVIAVISVATSQFTSIISHVDFEDLSGTLQRARYQLGIALAYPQQFRQLDELSTSLDQSIDPVSGESVEDDELTILTKLEKAKSLLLFLHENVEGPPGADADAEIAELRLNEFETAVKDYVAQEEIDLVDQANTRETFDRLSVRASAAIRSWMRSKLGGTFKSQVRLMANPSAEDFRELLRSGREVLQPRFVSVTSATGSYVGKFVVGLIVLVVAIYFFLIDGASMIKTLMRLSPLDDAYEARLLMEFDRTSRAVVLASVVSALAQGVLAAIAYWLCGFESLILLFLITSLMALVPFLGAASVWVPCVIYLAAVDQRYTAAIVLAIYGAAIVSSIDNVIKMFVLQGRSTLHPLFALLSVLGGISVFGPVGIVVGPMVVVFLQALLEILNHELAEREHAGEPETAPE